MIKDINKVQVLTIGASGDTVDFTFNTPSNAKNLRRVGVTSSTNNFGVAAGTISMRANQEEIYPEGFPARLLFPALNQAHPCNLPEVNGTDGLRVGNTEVKGSYVDNGTSAAYPHDITISLYLTTDC